MGSEAAMKKRPHAVCLPCPEQGHITPMLKLTKLLHARGFHITFVNTEFNHRRLLRSRGPDALNGVPGFHFAAIPDGLPPSDADATQDVPTRCKSTSTKCLPHLLALLADLNAPTSEVPPVTCLVVDGVMSFGIDAAREIGVPVASLWTASACGFMGYYNIRQLLDRGLVPRTTRTLPTWRADASPPSCTAPSACATACSCVTSPASSAPRTQTTSCSTSSWERPSG
jgi:hypothetical protein